MTTDNANGAGAKRDVRDVLIQFSILDLDLSEDTIARKAVAHRLTEAVLDPNSAKALLNELFPDGITTDASFFFTLCELRDHVGYDAIADEALACVWIASMQTMSVSMREQLLEEYASGREVFNFIECLRLVLVAYPFPATFLADWFGRVAKRVERDMMQSHYWQAVREFCLKDSDCALDILRKYTSSTDESQLQVAANMLGTLRTKAADSDQSTALRELEQAFELNTNPLYRNVYHRSWITTAYHFEISDAELSLLINCGENGSIDDLNAVVFAISRILLSPRLLSEQFDLARAWIGQHIESTIGRDAKHEVARVVNRLSHPDGPIDHSVLLDLNEWMIRMQPLPNEDLGTWSELEEWLCNLIKRDDRLFRAAFEQLAVANGSEMYSVMMRPRTFDHLMRQLRTIDTSGLVGSLIGIPQRYCRQIGILLFDELGIERIPHDAFARDPRIARLLFYEMQCSVHNPQTIARLLFCIFSELENSDDEFRKEFNNELRLQLRNYSGECRSELERLGGDIAEVRLAINEIADSFKELKRAHEAGISAMQVPGYRRAATLHHRRMSREIREGAKQYSTFLSLEAVSKPSHDDHEAGELNKAVK